MVWEELDFDKPHVAYCILGGFTSLFMLCSLFIKEKLYIGEATVATLVGVIFGPHAAALFDPNSWGNVDKITLELSRIVLVVQCFAVGVELPKAYMERHWRSVFFLLVPVMTAGWLVTSLIIWLCIVELSWLESLAVAACVTATDPVLASSVVGKGKFAKRVPKHLRDILSAESGCNDGMAFPFIYLSFYLLYYHSDAKEVTFHWIVFLILYECVFGAVYGFLVGYIGRHAIKYAERKNLIDRDSLLVFYFVLALFCAGTASGLGLDDLLVGFAAGVGFSNDGWFVEKTEESHVSNVIDLLLNLSYFVYLGAIIPWQDYNDPEIGLVPWRLVVIAIAVILFRRIPAMMLMKPAIPDVKNWREALFAGHFGPIGVGAIFAVILLRAELETDSTEPLADLPRPDQTEFYLLIRVCWPIVTFLVIASILVHGSSIAVFTLGKRINTLTLTMSYTTEGEQNWMDRLPRIASRSKSMSLSKGSRHSMDSSSPENEKDFAPGTLGPIGVPRNFLRRQKEDENGGQPGFPLGGRRPRHRRRRLSAGGPIDESAISPVWRRNIELEQEKQDAAEGEDTSPDGVELDERGAEKLKEEEESHRESSSPEIEAYQEGHHLIVEDAEGNVIDKRDIRGESPERVKKELLEDLDKLRKETSGEYAKNRHHPHERNEGEELEEEVKQEVEHPHQAWRKWLGSTHKATTGHRERKGRPHSGPAQAYQYGDKIIVEDADGEVVKSYDIPRSNVKPKGEDNNPRRALTRMSTWTFGRQKEAEQANESEETAGPTQYAPTEDEEDKHVRFRVGGSDRRMSKQDFIKQIQSLDPKTRVAAVSQVDAPEDLKNDVTQHARAENRLNEHGEGGNFLTRKLSRDEGGAAANFLARKLSRDDPGAVGGSGIGSFLTRKFSRGQTGAPQAEQPEMEASSSRSPQRPQQGRGRSSSNASSAEHQVEGSGKPIPRHDIAGTIAAVSAGQPETAAQRRRRLASERSESDPAAAEGAGSDSDDDGTERVPPSMRHRRPSGTNVDIDDEEETAAERKRRLAALGQADTEEDDSEDDGSTERVPRQNAQRQSSTGSATLRPGPSPLVEPQRAHIRDRAIGVGGSGGVAQSVVPSSPIAEEDENTPVEPFSPSPVRETVAEEPENGDHAAPAQADSPRNPGIRFAEMPRGEGRGRSTHFGRTMGMKRSKKR